MYKEYEDVRRPDEDAAGRALPRVARWALLYVAPDEQKYVTPETIRATTIVGGKEEVVERLRSMERAGLSQVFINPPMDGYNDCIDDISRDVIARM